MLEYQNVFTINSKFLLNMKIRRYILLKLNGHFFSLMLTRIKIKIHSFTFQLKINEEIYIHTSDVTIMGIFSENGFKRSNGSQKISGRT